MYRIAIKVSAFFLLIMFLSTGFVLASRNKTLVTANGIEYTAQDFSEWWQSWRDRGMVFPDSPQEFIDFHLVAEDGRMMEFDLTPEFQRAVRIFLTVRALGILKYEEIDKKNIISEEQIRAYFEENYTPIWSVQILSYADQTKAEAVVDEMKKFDGQKAGRLVFADFSAVDKKEGGPHTYDDQQVYPRLITKDRQTWLKLFSSLNEGRVSEAIFVESFGRYVVVRMDDVISQNEDVFEEKRTKIEKILKKKGVNELTLKLIEKLKKKFHVNVDKDFLDSLILQEEYPREILSKPVVTMDDLELSAENLIFNAKREQQLRGGLPENQLKNLVVTNFISQKVTDKEALGRHFEKDKLKKIYDFYTKNTFRKAVFNDIKNRTVVTDDDVEKYYKENISTYSLPDKLNYVLVQGDVDLITNLFRAVSRGGDLFDEARAVGLEAKINDSVDPSREAEIAEALSKLQKGELSDPFAIGRISAMARLLNRTNGGVISLDRIRDKIELLLREDKFNRAKQSYIEKLRSSTNIEIDQKVWLKLKEESENEKK